MKNDNLSVEVKKLSKKFKNNSFSLDGVDLKLTSGHIVGFIGKNGAGKTTVISCMLGLLEKDNGEIKLLGKVYEGQNHIKEHVGVVLDDLNFSLLLSPLQINKIMKKIYKNWNEKNFMNYLSRFELPFNIKTKNFSFGMKKKLSLAIALSHETHLLILDEITSGLDPVSRDDILCVLLDYIENPDNSVFISSHITTDLEKIADYIVFIDNGRIILKEEKDELIYGYGIIRCGYSKFSEIDKNDIISCQKDGERVNILVKEREKIGIKYKDLIVNRPSLDEILLILTSDEVIK